MRRLVVLGLVGALAFTLVGTPASRAATVSSTWPVGAQPFGLAVDESTGKVYVANSGSVVYDINNPSSGPHGLISVVDPATGVVGRILTSQNSNFVVVDSVRRRLYSSNGTTSGSSRSVDSIDIDSGAILATVPVGGLGMALDPVAGRLYVADVTSLKVIDTSTFAVVATASAPATAYWFGVAVDPERHQLYVTNIQETSPKLFVLDDRDLGGTPRSVPLATATRFAVAVDPVSRSVFVAGGQFDGQAVTSAFSVIDPDTLSVIQQTSIPGYAIGMALAPARHRIYVSDNNGWRLYGLDDTTFAVAETLRLPFAPGELLMSPDGRLFAGDYDSGSHLDSRLVALDLANHAPVFQSLTLTPSTPFTGEVLRADPSAFDPDFGASLGGTPVAYSYEWSRNGAVLVGETGATLDLARSGNGDRGDTISVRVTASDGEMSTDSSSSVVVSDSAPTASVSLSSSAPATNAVLRATALGTDADNDSLSYRFVWKVNGLVRQTTVGPNGSDNFDLGIAGNGDHGDAVVVELVASDGTLQSAVVSAGATIVNSQPTVAVSVNTTTPTPKTVLVANAMGQDPDRDGLTYVYTWKLNGVLKRTVTTTSTTDKYDVSVKGNGKKGDVVTLTVTASDGTLTSPVASLSATIR
jgi:DNA-binding beta-propeller fold protein YncE